MIRFFRHYVPLNLLLLILVEAFILGGSVYVGVGAGQAGAAAHPDLLAKSFTFALVMLGLMTASGLYNLEQREGLLALLQRLGLSFGLGLIAMSLIFTLFPALLVERGAFLLAFGLALIGVLASRAFFSSWTRAGMLKTRALVIGTGSRAAQIEALFAKRGQMSNTHVVGYVPMGGSHHFVDHARILDTGESLPQLAARLQIGELILAVRDRRGGGLPVQELLECKLRGVRITELSSFLALLNFKWVAGHEG